MIIPTNPWKLSGKGIDTFPLANMHIGVIFHNVSQGEVEADYGPKILKKVVDLVGNS